MVWWYSNWVRFFSISPIFDIFDLFITLGSRRLYRDSNDQMFRFLSAWNLLHRKRYGIGSYFKAYIKIVLIASPYPANIMSILILFDSNFTRSPLCLFLAIYFWTFIAIITFTHRFHPNIIRDLSDKCLMSHIMNDWSERSLFRNVQIIRSKWSQCILIRKKLTDLIFRT